MTAPDTVAGALLQTRAPDQYPAYEQRIADRSQAAQARVPDQAAVLRFAAALTLHRLPPAAYGVERDDPTVYVHVHQGFSAFEQWREALGIPTSAVTCRTLPGHSYLRGETTAPGGITVRVTGYSTALPEVDR